MKHETDALLDLCRAVRQNEAPSSADRRAVRRHLAKKGLIAATAGVVLLTPSAATASSSLVTSAAGAATAKTSVAALMLYVTAGVCGGLALAAGSGAFAPATAAAPSAASSAPPRTAPSSKPAAPSPLSAEPKPFEPALVVPSFPAPPARRRVPQVAQVATTAVFTLSDETMGLSEVQRALRDGGAQRALSLLGEQDRRFAQGALAAERAAARILALQAAGHADQGCALAAQFLQKNVNSPLARRIRESCAGK